MGFLGSALVWQVVHIHEEEKEGGRLGKKGTESSMHHYHQIHIFSLPCIFPPSYPTNFYVLFTHWLPVSHQLICSGG